MLHSLTVLTDHAVLTECTCSLCSPITSPSLLHPSPHSAYSPEFSAHIAYSLPSPTSFSSHFTSSLLYFCAHTAFLLTPSPHPTPPLTQLLHSSTSLLTLLTHFLLTPFSTHPFTPPLLCSHCLLTLSTYSTYSPLHSHYFSTHFTPSLTQLLYSTTSLLTPLTPPLTHSLLHSLLHSSTSVLIPLTHSPHLLHLLTQPSAHSNSPLAQILHSSTSLLTPLTRFLLTPFSAHSCAHTTHSLSSPTPLTHPTPPPLLYPLTQLLCSSTSLCSHHLLSFLNHSLLHSPLHSPLPVLTPLAHSTYPPTSLFTPLLHLLHFTNFTSSIISLLRLPHPFTPTFYSIHYFTHSISPLAPLTHFTSLPIPLPHSLFHTLSILHSSSIFYVLSPLLLSTHLTHPRSLLLLPSFTVCHFHFYP